MDSSKSGAGPNNIADDPFLRPLVELGLTYKEIARHKKLPRASILVLLFRWNGQWQVLLTQRPLSLKSHAGEVCCPGGKQDDADGGDDVLTALRETQEEVGIEPSEFLPLARTETVESVGGLCVTPIVAVWKNPVLPSQLKPNHDEVEAVFYVPISYFWNEENCEDKYDVEWRGGIFTMRTYHNQDTLEVAPPATPKVFKIWGLTAAVVYNVANLCHPQPTTSWEGTLYRWMDQASGKPYWVQRYFVLSKGQGPRVLHQYDTQRKAQSKAHTATKKNRLLLDDCQVTAVEEMEGDKYVVSIAVLEGRVQWKLAATTVEDRDIWISVLRANEQAETPHKKFESEETG